MQAQSQVATPVDASFLEQVRAELDALSWGKPGEGSVNKNYVERIRIFLMRNATDHLRLSCVLYLLERRRRNDPDLRDGQRHEGYWVTQPSFCEFVPEPEARPLCLKPWVEVHGDLVQSVRKAVFWILWDESVMTGRAFSTGVAALGKVTWISWDDLAKKMQTACPPIQLEQNFMESGPRRSVETSIESRWSSLETHNENSYTVASHQQAPKPLPLEHHVSLPTLNAGSFLSDPGWEQQNPPYTVVNRTITAAPLHSLYPPTTEYSGHSLPKLSRLFGDPGLRYVDR
jgi:hypothetical protein